MAVLAGGAFSMGLGPVSRPAWSTETPVQHSIAIAPYALDATEVTVARFERFWEAGHPAPPTEIPYPCGRTQRSAPFGSDVLEPGTSQSDCTWAHRADPAYAQHPINCVSWATAMAFCVWDGGRLPSGAEYEWVSRRWPTDVDAPSRYPWGNRGDCATASAFMTVELCTRSAADFLPGIVAAHQPYLGIYDLAGNVNEFTADAWEDYGAAPCRTGGYLGDPLCRLPADADRADSGVRVEIRSSDNGLVPTLGDGMLRSWRELRREPERAFAVFDGFRCARSPPR